MHISLTQEPPAAGLEGRVADDRRSLLEYRRQTPSLISRAEWTSISLHQGLGERRGGGGLWKKGLTCQELARRGTT